jgi:hypothetical protein
LNKTVCIYGPQGCGKTLHSARFANHFGLARIIDDWFPGDRWPPLGALLLTYEKPNVPDYFRRVISFDEAMRLCPPATVGA